MLLRRSTLLLRMWWRLMVMTSLRRAVKPGRLIWRGMMRGLTGWRPGSLPGYAQLRMPMKCSGSSPCSTTCLSGPTSEGPSGSTRLSLYREARMTSRCSTCSPRLVRYPTWETCPFVWLLKQADRQAAHLLHEEGGGCVGEGVGQPIRRTLTYQSLCFTQWWWRNEPSKTLFKPGRVDQTNFSFTIACACRWTSG